MCICLSIVAALFALTVSVVVADKPLAVTVDSEPFHGNLVSADSSGLLTFDTEDGRREVPAGDLVRWGTCVEPDRAPLFLLRNGTLLVAGILEVTEEQLALDSDAIGLVRLPRTQLAAVILQFPASSLDRDRLLDDAARGGEDSTRVVMLNGDQMRGELVELDEQSVSIRTAVGPVRLEFERISTITLARSADPAGILSDSTIVGLADGSRIVAAGVTIKDQTAVSTLGGGLSWKADVAEVVFLQPASSRITYLSDMEPIGYRQVPFLDRTWRYRNDRNVLGGHMRCAGQMYLRGLGMHTAARISYVPPNNARVFQARLGIDDVTEGLGSVRFRVFVDGNQKYVSPTVRGLEAPVSVAVDVKEAKRVDLVVDFADRADVQDHANWLGARFVSGE